MNPYVLAGLAMCGVIAVALVGTAYLAVYFTRRAKADLEKLLQPLADFLDGEMDLGEASVSGTWDGTIAMARMAGAAGGTVRVWQVDIIDAAGGDAWNYVYSRPKKGQGQPVIDVVTENRDIAGYLARVNHESIEVLEPDATDWVQVEYNPDRGFVRVARPMHGRNDIPAPQRLEQDLRFLRAIGDENRSLQERQRNQDGARAQ